MSFLFTLATCHLLHIQQQHNREDYCDRAKSFIKILVSYRSNVPFYKTVIESWKTSQPWSPTMWSHSNMLINQLITVQLSSVSLSPTLKLRCAAPCRMLVVCRFKSYSSSFLLLSSFPLSGITWRWVLDMRGITRQWREALVLVGVGVASSPRLTCSTSQTASSLFICGFGSFT